MRPTFLPADVSLLTVEAIPRGGGGGEVRGGGEEEDGEEEEVRIAKGVLDG